MSIAKILLFPFSLLYYAITWLRNFLYNKGVLKSFEFTLPIILVGNLSTGGSGKTPHVEYLIRLLKDRFPLATLSRGYGRKTRGFFLATPLSLVEDVGDEPKLFVRKYDGIEVAVGEERLEAVPGILEIAPDTRVILMDDGFQHRKIMAGMNILLCPFHNPWYRDMLLPAGRLREPVSGAARADCILVSKCPPELASDERMKIETALKLRPGQKCFFTKLRYGNCYYPSDKSKVVALKKNTRVAMLCGIADPGSMRDYLKTNANLCQEFIFGDHHEFTEKDIRKIADELKYRGLDDCLLVCTEKDAMRLLEIESIIRKAKLNIVCLPVEVEFLFQEAADFEEYILNYIDNTLKESE